MDVIIPESFSFLNVCGITQRIGWLQLTGRSSHYFSNISFLANKGYMEYGNILHLLIPLWEMIILLFLHDASVLFIGKLAHFLSFSSQPRQ